MNNRGTRAGGVAETFICAANVEGEPVAYARLLIGYDEIWGLRPKGLQNSPFDYKPPPSTCFAEMHLPGPVRRII